jgi:hypothetical protein
MKTNLDSMFKTSTDLELEGIWFEINETTAFKLKRFGGKNAKAAKAATAKHYKPFAKKAEFGGLSPEEDFTIVARMFIDTCLTEWRGVEVDGEPLELTHENALELFTSLPELFNALYSNAQSVDNYKEVLGND